ncbi:MULTISPECIES: AAA family ATPase [unclassified Variovorax]|uniref:AAA family ATPase n=1 Tax=unclassified Variovorax TaxID=663243 RepID=UPI001317D174|nr:MULTISPECIES: AAA family ATPase [unclassified Variovorax]VTU42772.1 CCA tRNA nucleotidyltransferase [Variovorax sp. PBL-H6]VTU43692.1 CCA tRNA nucleotidyltransferase [Variovorax sp. SRS16]VTU43756.1 CCA tRNA nucleotidyltransferase [Variovorax sp. PBL-E5]
MNKYDAAILAVGPAAGRRDIDWKAVEDAYPEWRSLAETPQDRHYHAEGDCWTHTKMVCEELVNLADFQALDARGQQRMFLGALMHDIAKPGVTKVDENGRISSKGHSKRGEVDARIRLWRAGYDFSDREAVCRMIRYHQEPFISLRKANAAFLAHKWSHEVNLRELALLAEADARGRRTDPASDWQNTIDNVELFRLLAQEQECYGQPRHMADEHTAVSYFRREGEISPDYPFFAQPGSEVIVLSGLPATGKNHWLDTNHPELPVVSFDDAREELDLAHGENDGKAAHFAVDKAKELLRRRVPFAWNSTHLSAQMRQKTLDLLYAYDARVRIVYLEQPEDVLLSRNNKRDSTLSNKALLGMLFRWEVPLPTESHRVDYQPGTAART